MREPRIPMTKKSLEDLQSELDKCITIGNEKKAKRIIDEMVRRERIEIK